MLSGPPLPLPPEFPLRLLTSLIQNERLAGAWIQGSGPRRRLTISAGGRSVAVTIGQDLGQLLSCCARIVVRSGSSPIVVTAGALLHWRALQVVVGAAPGPDQLKGIFPDAELEPHGFWVSTGMRSPEEVLASCVRHGIPVMESRVVYRRR
jgi:hypothetical protein